MHRCVVLGRRAAFDARLFVSFWCVWVQVTAQVRTELADAHGNFVGRNISLNATFSVTSGPGQCHMMTVAHA